MSRALTGLGLRADGDWDAEPGFMDKPDWTANLERLRALIVEARGDRSEDDKASVRAFLVELSRRVGRSFSPAIRDELEPDAILSLLAEKVNRFRSDGGAFVPWCHVVVQNHASTLRRTLQRDGLGRTKTGSSGSSREIDLLQEKTTQFLGNDGSLNEELESIGERFQVLRLALNDVTWEPEGSRRVDYYAVLLLHLRMILAARLQRYTNDGNVLPMFCWSKFIEFCLPWRGGEGQRYFRPGEPSLADVWTGLASRIDASEDDIPLDLADELLGTMESLGSDRLTIDVWHQWTKRARDQVRTRLAPEAWDRAFASWFPYRGGLGPKRTKEVSQ